MARGGGKVKKTKPQVVAKVGVEREDGFLYFIDRDGDVSRVKMARAGRRRKKVTSRRPAAKRASTRRPAAKGTRRPAAKRKIARGH
jgi:hypothetical protein